MMKSFSPIKQINVLIACILLAVTPSMTFAALTSSNQPRVVVQSSAGVTTDFFTLGDIAAITPAPEKSKASALLAATVVGRAALPGSTRQINRGDILLKLRQAGIDPSSVDLEGATTIYVTTNGASESAPSSSGSTSSAPVKPPAVAVKPGDPVDVILEDGPVSVRAKATAVSGGAVGDQISIRRDGSLHTLKATIIDEGTVQLEE